jgi:putative redox protein
VPDREDKTMQCTINWMPASGMAFSAETGSGHLLMMDGAPDGGGRNLAPRPMETVLAGTGGCTAYRI